MENRLSLQCFPSFDRAERGLDIDMRIGVHSGSLLAGIIGEAKLQFDIWGTLG